MMCSTLERSCLLLPRLFKLSRLMLDLLFEIGY